MKLTYSFHINTYKYFNIEIQVPAAEGIKFVAVDPEGYIFGYRGDNAPKPSKNGDWWSRGDLGDPSPFMLGHVSFENGEHWQDTCQAVKNLERIYK